MNSDVRSAARSTQNGESCMSHDMSHDEQTHHKSHKANSNNNYHYKTKRVLEVEPRSKFEKTLPKNIPVTGITAARKRGYWPRLGARLDSLFMNLNC